MMIAKGLRGLIIVVLSVVSLLSPAFAVDEMLRQGDAAYDKGLYTEAAGFYKKASEQGNAEAQNRLGLLYYNGQGVPQDYAEAEKWFIEAAAQGNPEALLNLRYSFNKGQDTEDREAQTITEDKKINNHKRASKKKVKAKKRSKKIKRGGS